MVSRFILKFCNAIINVVLALVLLVAGCYSAYALWDNNQVLVAAENVRDDLLRFKPAIPLAQDASVDNTESFATLQELNPDVVGWLSMDNTRIDFPVLQGENNLIYVNRDVYGNFSLSGSIFLDTRNNPSFSDPYSLLYGHHMAEGNMFGDLDLYKEASFFQNNKTGFLILPERTYKLEVVSCMLVNASDGFIFEPEYAAEHRQELFDYVETSSLFFHKDTLQQARENEDLQLLALSTCSSEFTDARTIVITIMKDISMD